MIRKKPQPKWFTTEDAAKALCVSVRTIERWRAEGKFIPARSTSGGHSRYSLEQVEKLQELKNCSSCTNEPKQNQKQGELKVKEKAPITKPISTPCSFSLPSHDEFVTYVCDFLEKSNIKPSMFGRMTLNDSGSIQRLKEGTDPRLSTMLKICEAVEKVKQDQALAKMLREVIE